MSDQATSRSPELEELLTLAITSFLEDVHTGLPGRIEEYFPATQKADIKPLIKRRIVHEDGTELLEELPVIPDVPIAFDRTGKFFITFPLAKGDLVRLHFLERSIDNYLSGDGEDTDPDEFRMHDLSDAIAVPGLYPFKRSIKDINGVNLVMGNDEGGIQIHLTPDGTLELKLAGVADEAVALGNALQSFWNDVFLPIYNSHIHPTGVGPSGQPAVPGPMFDINIISKVLLLRGP
jgi:hypothetical protein